MKSYLLKSMGILFILLLSNCSNDDGSSDSSCILGPCGTIEASKINITINIKELVVLNMVEEFSDVSLEVDGIFVPIDVSGINISSGMFYSCWTIIPSSNITAIRFSLDGIEYELSFNDNLSSNALELIILQSDEDFFIDIYGYEECNDNTTN